MKSIRAVVVGMGYWGPKVARNIYLNPDFELVGVCDVNEDLARESLKKFGASSLPVYSNLKDLADKVNFEFVVIATPASTHYQLASTAISFGKNVLLEKPFGLDLQEKERLLNEAEKNNVKILVDHTYLFTPEFNKVKELLASNEIGSLQYYQSTRANLGLIQKDISVVEDLAIHDLAILDILKPELPISVSCTGSAFSPSEQISTAAIQMTYRDRFLVNLFVSWNSPVKVREINISGSTGVITWNDSLGSDKIKIFNSRIDNDLSSEKMRISYHLGEGRIPSIVGSEAINNELNYLSDILIFSDSKDAQTGPNHIMRTGKILAALKLSLQNDGMTIMMARDEN
jgi:predicted dehydrogenase